MNNVAMSIHVQVFVWTYVFISLGWNCWVMATHFSILAYRVPMDRGAWQAAVAKSQTWMSD